MSSCPQVLCIRGCWDSCIRSRIISTRWLPKCHHAHRCCEYGGCWKQLYGHQSPISKTIQIRWTKYAGHCWRRKDELILHWTPAHGRASVGQPTRTYIQQLCTDTGCRLEDLPEGMDERDEWWERRESVLAAWLDDDDVTQVGPSGLISDGCDWVDFLVPSSLLHQSVPVLRQP